MADASNPLIHPLTDAQQKQVALMQSAVDAANNRLGVYLQAIVDGFDADPGVAWTLEGGRFVGTVPAKTVEE